MDKPATVLAAVIGLVLIGVSLPFLILDGGGDAQRYNIAWSQVGIGSGDAAFAGPGTDTAVPLAVAGMPSNVTVTLECSDTRPAPQVQSAATITWELFEDGRSIDSGTIGCTPGDVERISRATHPDIGSATAESANGAEESTYDNVTREYRLVFSWNRPAGQVPTGGLPVGQPTFAGRMGIEVEGWRATANEPEEATR